ncbi:MAG: right-handed parallel beta-helix repeat-containing protein [Kiritimatiellales bacterium]|nr:right-handed parallel beta-helix repeat-containing protein [Kiritimatiellales bacterium]
MKLAIGFLCFAAVLSSIAHEVYVGEDGTADGNGSRKNPFATLGQARDSIRAGRKSGAIKGGEKITVYIGPGTYSITESFKLTKEDGGSEGAPVVYKALERGKARLCGGVRLKPDSFKPVNDESVLKRLDPSVRSRILVCDVSPLAPAGGFPKLKIAYKGAPQSPLLYVDHRPMTIARWPNLEAAEGNWVGFSNVIDTGIADPDNPDPAKRKAHPGAFVFEDARPQRWDIDSGVWLFGYWTHDWSDEVIKISSYDRDTKTIHLAAPHHYGIKGKTWGRKERRFYALNLLEELDAPGEWYLDRKTNRLYFYPGDGFESARIILTTLTKPMVECVGTRHVEFQGLELEYGHAIGFVLKQVDHIDIRGCVVANFAGGGISLIGENCSVQSCDVFNAGRTGIWVNGGNRATLTKAGNRIENNHVHDFGLYQRTYAAGISLQGCGQIMRNNRIHDAPHSAVLYSGNEHLLEYNEVFRVVMETGDAGAFYTGRDWTTQGNVLRYNYVHHLGGGDENHVNTMGFYFDDCDCGDEVTGNIFFRAGRAIMIGGGREHPVVNNLIVDCPIGLHIDARGMKWDRWNNPAEPSWMLEKKAEKLNYKQPPWSDHYPRLARIMEDSPREPLYNPIRNNVFVDCRNEICNFDKEVMGLMDKFEIENNLAVFTASAEKIPLKDGVPGFTTLNGSNDAPIDLGFRDAEQGDFNLCAHARLLKLAPQFKEIPFNKIGLYRDKFRGTLPDSSPASISSQP